eukprot:CAMPEP_0172061662 /NCGR_PEP_ID=MMETSP1043-20130122/8613_1 /TAXON_ID=464988 /ORGANISM="Hemiselmis andersenii, Strain CCMP441" /LENGTH=99 /DNA_ID=CAMNT_0012721501 /DNA_START=187 /DNA_END=482 /DNA_ORIENTATION=-
MIESLGTISSPPPLTTLGLGGGGCTSFSPRCRGSALLPPLPPPPEKKDPTHAYRLWQGGAAVVSRAFFAIASSRRCFLALWAAEARGGAAHQLSVTIPG